MFLRVCVSESVCFWEWVFLGVCVSGSVCVLYCVHACVRLFVCSFVPSYFVRSYVCSFVRSFVRSVHQHFSLSLIGCTRACGSLTPFATTNGSPTLLSSFSSTRRTFSPKRLWLLHFMFASPISRVTKPSVSQNIYRWVSD